MTKDSWLKTLARFKPGDSVPVTVKRDRRTIKTNIVLGQPERFDYTIEEKADATVEQKALRARVVEWEQIATDLKHGF